MAAMASSSPMAVMATPAAVLLAALVLMMLSGAEAKFLRPNNITVVGSVYCDACSNNTFSKHSFFLKGECRCYQLCSFCIDINGLDRCLVHCFFYPQ
jgi:hypothetical protein